MLGAPPPSPPPHAVGLERTKRLGWALQCSGARGTFLRSAGGQAGRLFCRLVCLSPVCPPILSHSPPLPTRPHPGRSRPLQEAQPGTGRHCGQPGPEHPPPQRPPPNCPPPRAQGGFSGHPAPPPGSEQRGEQGSGRPAPPRAGHVLCVPRPREPPLEGARLPGGGKGHVTLPGPGGPQPPLPETPT